MRVNIDEIKEVGLERSWDLSREQLDEMVKGDRAGYRARGPARVEARLSRLGRRIRLAASARAELTCPCGRCLEPVGVAVPVDFELILIPTEEIRDEVDEIEEGERARLAGSFEPDEADEEPLSGKVVDLDAMLREQILLALPAYPVCGESCKGLCPVCGTNLNERDCRCDRRVPDPRWAALEKLRRH